MNLSGLMHKNLSGLMKFPSLVVSYYMHHLSVKNTGKLSGNALLNRSILAVSSKPRKTI